MGRYAAHIQGHIKEMKARRDWKKRNTTLATLIGAISWLRQLRPFEKYHTQIKTVKYDKVKKYDALAYTTK